MKKYFFLGMVMIAIMSFNPMLNAQSKHGYISVDEVVQLMPEYKKAMAEMSGFDSALQINYAETLKELNRQDSIFKADSTKWSNAIRTANREKNEKAIGRIARVRAKLSAANATKARRADGSGCTKSKSVDQRCC